MNITNTQIELICNYYTVVVGYKPEKRTIGEMAVLISRRMYKDLIDRKPEYKQVFNLSETEMFHLECKVFEMLRFVVIEFLSYRDGSIKKSTAIDKIIKAYSRIGITHKKLAESQPPISLTEAHFSDVGESLIVALKEPGIKIWSSQMEEAWCALYIDLVTIMKKAMDNE